MKTILLFLCLVIGTLFCAGKAMQNFKKGELFSGFVNTMFAVSGLGLSIWAAFLYFQLWAALLYTAFWIWEVAASAVDFKKRSSLK